jgi:hypothetical protein
LGLFFLWNLVGSSMEKTRKLSDFFLHEADTIHGMTPMKSWGRCRWLTSYWKPFLGASGMDSG